MFFSFFDLLRFLIYSCLSYFLLLVLFCTMSKEIGRFYKNNRSKLSTPTLNKPVLLSSDYHASSAINSTRKSISSRLYNKHITTNQISNNISNTDDIHSCVTSHKNIVFRPHLQPLIWRHWMLQFLLHLLIYTQKLNYPLMVNNICVFRLSVNFLVLPSV